MQKRRYDGDDGDTIDPVEAVGEHAQPAFVAATFSLQRVTSFVTGSECTPNA